MNVLMVLILSFAHFFIVEVLNHDMPRRMPPPMHEPLPPMPNFSIIILHHYYKSLILILLGDLLGAVFFLIKETQKNTKRVQKLKQEKSETELKLLKAQINPHFIFNALNNIYALSYTKSEKAPDIILKLSEMLRYVFVDCSNDKVPIRSEIKYIENYIAFQKMKSDEKQNINFDFNINAGETKIAPMLFIPLIENSFKYSQIEEKPDAFVNMSLKVESNNIIFNLKNSLQQNSDVQKGSGMGINNVKQRLNILYPNQYILNLNVTENTFEVDFKINIE